MKIEDIKQCFCGGVILQRNIDDPHQFNCLSCRNNLHIESDVNENLVYIGYLIGADIYSVYIANIATYRFRTNESYTDYESLEEAFERMKVGLSYRCLE